MDIRLNSDGTWNEIGGNNGEGAGCLFIFIIIMYCSGVFDRCSCVRCGSDTDRYRIVKIDQSAAIGYTTVNVNVANLRKGPGTTYDYYSNSNGKKIQLNRGYRLDVLEDVNGWYKIIAPNGGTAYIKKSLCSEIRYVKENSKDGDETAESENNTEEVIDSVEADNEAFSPQIEVSNSTNNNPIIETRQGGLIKARVGDISYDYGIVRIKIVITTSTIRRQFRLNHSYASNMEGEYVRISDVSVSGLQKYRDYYIITVSDAAELTIEIPNMPESGGFSMVRVDMSLSGTIEWVIVKNINW